MMNAIAEFVFETLLGKIVAGGLLAMTLLTWFAWDQRAKGARNAIAEVNTSAHHLAKDAEAVRSRALRPGAFGRLLDNSCRDC